MPEFVALINPYCITDSRFFGHSAVLVLNVSAAVSVSIITMTEMVSETSGTASILIRDVAPEDFNAGLSFPTPPNRGYVANICIALGTTFPYHRLNSAGFPIKVAATSGGKRDLYHCSEIQKAASNGGQIKQLHGDSR
jgi:hypothetical protein